MSETKHKKFPVFSIGYFILKFLYIIVVLIQIGFISNVLKTNYDWGFQMLQNNSTAQYFPLITFCDFKIKEQGGVNDHTIQCVLMNNIFNEKIYIFFWFWFVFIISVTCINIIYLLMLLLFKNFRYMTNENIFKL